MLQLELEWLAPGMAVQVRELLRSPHLHWVRSGLYSLISVCVIAPVAPGIFQAPCCCVRRMTPIYPWLNKL